MQHNPLETTILHRMFVAADVRRRTPALGKSASARRRSRFPAALRDLPLDLKLIHPALKLFLRPILLVALAMFLCQTTFGALKTGDAFPDLSTFKLEGKLPEQLKGKIVIVDFWASWCGPCKESFPAMNELFKKYSDKGLVIIAVNADEVRADMESFLKDNPAAFTVVRDAKQKLVEKVDVDSMPSSFILDRDGKVRFMHVGFHGEVTRKQYEEEIKSLLGT